jgi:putative ABC transport system substrate-binding protein
MRRIGVIVTDADGARLAAFRQGLERFGWSEGRNVRIDVRDSRGSAERTQEFVRELVVMQPDVILSAGPQVTAMFQRESGAIPIVFVSVADPIAFGLVASLARPGGNITGFLQYQGSITGKWLQMLKEIAPGLARVACMGAKRPVRLFSAGGRIPGAVARDRACADPHRDRRRQRARD